MTGSPIEEFYKIGSQYERI